MNLRMGANERMNRYGYSIAMEDGDIKVVPTGGPQYVGLTVTIGHVRITVRQLHMVIPNPDWEVAEHSQPDIEIHIIPYGKGLVQIEDTAFEVSSGELYVTGPGIKHRQKADPDNPMGEYCLSIDAAARPIPAASGRRQAAAAHDPAADEVDDLLRTLSDCHPFALKDAYRTKELFEDIFREAERGLPGYRMRVHSLVIELLLGVYRTLNRSKDGVYKYATAAAGHDEGTDRVARITAFITRRYMDNITVSDLAKAIYLSEKQTNRILKRAFNQTFKDYLSYHRFMAAKRMVLETQLSTDEIAYKCGFNDTGRLYKTFRKFNCPAPSRLRKLDRER